MTEITLSACGLTLDDYARIMYADPCGLAGIDPGGSYGCKIFSCRERTIFFNAIRRAQSYIESKTHRLFCDSSKVLKSGGPYWTLNKGDRLETVRTVDVTFTVEEDPEPGDTVCETIITLTGEIDPFTECDELIGAEIVWDKCLCPHLLAEWCYSDIVVDLEAETAIVTLKTRAYNLANSSEILDGTTLDWLPTEVTIRLSIKTPVKEGRVYWQPEPWCCPEEDPNCYEAACCHLECTTACVVIGLHGVVNAHDWVAPCETVCIPNPHHFELDIIRPGAWELHWSEAVVSLANNFIPADFCTCNPLSQERYQADTGKDEWASKQPLGYFANPFGVYTPGAKKAWEIVNVPVSGLQVFSI